MAEKNVLKTELSYDSGVGHFLEPTLLRAASYCPQYFDRVYSVVLLFLVSDLYVRAVCVLS